MTKALIEAEVMLLRPFSLTYNLLDKESVLTIGD